MVTSSESSNGRLGSGFKAESYKLQVEESVQPKHSLLPNVPSHKNTFTSYAGFQILRITMSSGPEEIVQTYYEG